MPKFFLPLAKAGFVEEAYADLARICSRSAPQVKDRVYSITFRHDSDEWTATVGEKLSGYKQVKKHRAIKVPVQDEAMVLAIFPVNPYMVVTDHRIRANSRSYWENPFLAGIPDRVVLFSHEDVE